ncbi:autotransporter-associated beta strand protein [Elusimicrobium simillimum]|uniref:autotransporter outer membrane beta-barrel domain-containing protein n=1 Tax=Elusimicrobium simillimum TaxID=3143438 RepID=UPI003C6EA514
MSYRHNFKYSAQGFIISALILCSTFVYGVCVEQTPGNFVCDGAGSAGPLSGATLDKNLSGQLELNGSNSFDTEVNINGGTLYLDGAAALGGAFILNVESGAEFKADGEHSLSNDVNTDGGTFTVESGTLTLGGVIGGDGDFIKDGAGILHVTGRFENAGTVTVNAGTLQGDSESFTKNIINNANVTFMQESDGTFLAAIYGGGNVDKKGAGTLTLAGQQYFTGNFNLLEGAIKGTSVSINKDIITSLNTAVIFDQRNGAGEYGNIISGGGALVKEGLDSLKLTGVNTYSGGTYIRDAAGIIINSDAALGAAGSNIFLESGALSLEDNSATSARDFILSTVSNAPNYINVADNLTYTINGVISGTSFVKKGLGTLILGGVNTHSGGTQVAEGTLSVSSQNSLGGGLLAVTDDGVFNPLNSMALDLNVYVRDNGAFDINSGDTLTVNGIVAGEGAVIKTGQGTLVLTETNLYENGVDVRAGTLEGNTSSIVGDAILSGGALTFAQDFDGVYSGDITGAAGTVINKTGVGLVEFTGTNNFDVFNILAGNALGANLNGNINVGGGAALMLAGDSGGTVNNSGKLYFDLTSDINYTGSINAASGSTIVLEAAQGAQGKVLIKDDGSTTQGNLNLAAGSTLEIITADTFLTGERLELISYEGALTGVFDGVTVAGGARVNAALDYSMPGSVHVLLSRMLSDYSSVSGLKRNQRALAHAIDSGSAVPNADFDLVLNTLDALPSAARSAALTRLGGFIYANIPGINSFNMLKENVYQRFEGVKDSEQTSRGIWAQATGTYRDTKANDYSEELYNFSGGFALGLDKYYADNFKAGLAASYTRHDLKHNKTENLDGDEYQLGVYALAALGAADIKTMLSTGYRTSMVKRNINFLGRTARARARSFNINLDTRASVKILELNGFELRPFAAVTGTFESRNSFEEEGANSANIKFNGDNIFYAAARAGAGVQKNARTYSYYADFNISQNINNPDMKLSIYSQDFTVKPAEEKLSYGVKVGGVKKFNDYAHLYAGAGRT